MAVGLATQVSSAAAGGYVSDVKPLLTRHCVSCHGEDQQKGGLRLDTAAAAGKGGHHGPAVRPGMASESLLIQVLEDRHPEVAAMPYKRPPLSGNEISRFRTWINSGAEAPANEEPGRQVHWAFVAPVRPELPRVREERWVRNPVDRFVLARLEQEGVEPSPEADRVTLLRRVHLDLVGLPPTPEEVEAFLSDDRPEAYERVVEGLLASPHYGERWGRWWLDVARYADSNGYSIDAPRTMWPWRDWVLGAFNQDLPFDRFVIEQLAGDLLPDATVAQRVATGFHRNTQINQEGGIDPEQFRIESVIDRVNTTGAAFLGLTVGCGQCHDHKFDPLTQREYFQLFAFFNNQEEPSLSIPTPAEAAALAAHRARVRDVEIDLAALDARPAAPEGTETEAANEGQGETVGAERRRLEAALKRLKRSAPRVTSAMVLAERTEPRDNYVFIKGDFTRHGPEVAPDTPVFLPPLKRREGAAGGVPSRLDLAQWLVDRGHPLTARVTVNRVWQQYFGRGLVATENDFGTQGTPPTHPELLDWLATTFMDSGWRVKALHRLIVTSATYRQSSHARPDLKDKDPTNLLLARQNRLRLDAEIVRDVALVASGALEPKVGGPSVFPPQPDGVMTLGQSRREWKASEGPDRFRRGLYTFYWRATPHPALAVFDAPDAFSACTRRLRSNTPLQALTLLNDAAFVELAERLAERVLREAPPDYRLEQAFRLCLARPPQPAERERLGRLLAEESRDHGETAAWGTLARVLLNLDETITRE